MKSLTLLTFTFVLALTGGIDVKAMTAQGIILDSKDISINQNTDRKQVKDSLNWSCSIFRQECDEDEEEP